MWWGNPKIYIEDIEIFFCGAQSYMFPQYVKSNTQVKALLAVAMKDIPPKFTSH